MALTQLNQLVTALRTQTEENSISPEMLGNVLQRMVDEINVAQSLIAAAQTGEFFFGGVCGVTVPGATETMLHMDNEQVDYNSTVSLISVGQTDGDAVVTAIRDCIVVITGQINMQPSGSYTSDRILHWFKYDDEGERYADSIMTTHYTGNTQIFNIPVNYSCYMMAGQTLYLSAFASGSNETLISEKSRLNIHAYLT